MSQTYDYTEAAIAAGIGDFEFEFNLGITPEIREFLDHYSNKISIVLTEEEFE